MTAAILSGLCFMVSLLLLVGLLLYIAFVAWAYSDKWFDPIPRHVERTADRAVDKIMDTFAERIE
jgi:fructose-specific phosphotransferase system IIC component